MPGFAWKLQNDQIVDVLTSIRDNRGNAAPSVSAADVAKARTAPGRPSGTDDHTGRYS